MRQEQRQQEKEEARQKAWEEKREKEARENDPSYRISQLQREVNQLKESAVTS
jgi:hypothetical protein